jgi:acetyl esterase/lipase
VVDRRDSTSNVPWFRAGGVAVAALIGVVGFGLVRNVAAAHAGASNVARRAAARLPATNAAATLIAAPSANVEPATLPDVEPSVDAVAPASAAEEAAATAERATNEPPTAAFAARPTCRAAVLVHGGGYFMGDHDTMKADFADPLRTAGFAVTSVDYPLLGDYPTIKIDPRNPWYPRNDLTSAPAPMRFVHDHAVDAVAPAIESALATGCTVTLVGVSAGGAIVADLANRYPQVADAVLVSSAALTTDHVGGAPLTVFYGSADDVIRPAASAATCDAWLVSGSKCVGHVFVGEGHASSAVQAAALAHVIALA